MSKKGLITILLYVFLNIFVYLLSFNLTYFLISVSLSTILTGVIVKLRPSFTGIKFKDGKSFYIMMVVGIGVFLLELIR